MLRYARTPGDFISVSRDAAVTTLAIHTFYPAARPLRRLHLAYGITQRDLPARLGLQTDPAIDPVPTVLTEVGI
ncbi:hypothetical protein NDU88_008342 [Pleurodeles waltl]|uniref:Uncharacterized protein n=1 Tax=Pleurodeles waltl TaxID=8319 RepID=A0AAV7RXP9_PLEWA|nr:hypothetical protein NDU88_008342 [Pleurodeles waltl]